MKLPVALFCIWQREPLLCQSHRLLPYLDRAQSPQLAPSG